MRQVVLRPEAAAIIGSLRSIGYSFDTAIADIIDNAISAEASLVSMRLQTLASRPILTIRDDGHGMDLSELTDAMRHGGAGSGRSRSNTDLGRYGLGLKTASLSQCRQLTVASIGPSGVLNIARWDLTEIEKQNDWILQFPDQEVLKGIEAFKELQDKGRGTVVMWTSFDLAVAGSAENASTLAKLLDEARSHLGLVFQRFLKGGDADPLIRLTINQFEVVGIDPFLRSNPKTQELPTERVRVRAATVAITGFILPQLKNIAAQELQTLGGPVGLRQGQGFYVYRNKRLIISATWFKMIRFDELTKLARVRIDLPNTLDDLWNLDVKKSVASPPEPVRVVLRRIVDRIADRSLDSLRARGRRAPGGPITPVWLRKAHGNTAAYVINREHPLIADLLDEEARGASRAIGRLLNLIEVSVPYQLIYNDLSSATPVESSKIDLEQTLHSLLHEWIKRCGSDLELRESLLQSLPYIEPFASNIELSESLAQVFKLAK